MLMTFFLQHQGISQIKQHICHHFQTKDLCKLRYLSGIKVAQSNNGIVICQRKYGLDILEETKLINSNFVNTLMDPNVKLLPSQRKPLLDTEKYRRIVGKLNNFNVTCPVTVSMVSQVLNSPYVDH